MNNNTNRNTDSTTTFAPPTEAELHRMLASHRHTLSAATVLRILVVLSAVLLCAWLLCYAEYFLTIPIVMPVAYLGGVAVLGLMAVVMAVPHMLWPWRMRLLQVFTALLPVTAAPATLWLVARINPFLTPAGTLCCTVGTLLLALPMLRSVMPPVHHLLRHALRPALPGGIVLMLMVAGPAGIVQQPMECTYMCSTTPSSYTDLLGNFQTTFSHLA